MNNINFNNVKFEAAYGTYKQLPKDDKIEFAFSGHSNVGKSSLLNAVFSRKSLARISSQPGKTVTINFYDADGIKFVDLPGYGYAKVSQSDKKRWADLVEGYLMGGRDVRLIIQLIDSRHAPTSDDIMMINFMIDNEVPFIIALTKSDKLNKSERLEREKDFAGEIPCYDQIKVIWTSTVKGEGIKEIRDILDSLAADET